jgi:type II secretory pathway component GspD/PulD (secretin)
MYELSSKTLRPAAAGPLGAGLCLSAFLACLLALLLSGCRSTHEPQSPPAEEPLAAPAEAEAVAAAEGETTAVDPAPAPPVPPEASPPEPKEAASAPAPDPRRQRLLSLLEEVASEAHSEAPLELVLIETARELESARVPPPHEEGLSEALERLAAAAAQAGVGAPPSPAPGAAPSPRHAEPAGAPAPPPPAAKPEPPPAAQTAPVQEPAARPVVPRPGGAVLFKQMFHKTSNELIGFLRENFPEWLEKGHVAKVEGKGRSVVIYGEKPEENDPLLLKISQVIDAFDDLELQLESRVIRPRYVDVGGVMDTLVMRGIANIWQFTEETDVATWKEGNLNRQATRRRTGYIQSGLVTGAVAPMPTPPKVPYVYEVPSTDPFQMPRTYSGQQQKDQLLVTFDRMSSTEERGGIVAVGTREDIERIQAFIDSIDVPARQIMIEVQVIELDANKLTDFGIDSIQFGSGHHIGGIALPLPGERIVQPGLGPDVRRDPETFVPPILTEGFSFAFDDTSIDLPGRFLTSIHALVREGEAKIKARPKILTLDDRTSILHIGRDVPTFRSTGVTRDTTTGNLISEIKEVTTVYVGFTLNIRPRVTGGADDRVSLQIEVIVNELADRQRVFEEDLLGIPSVIKRQYIGQNVVRNHRPIILGGLIQEQEVESVNKIPLLADIPLLGYLFRRTQSSQQRREVILVLTPHILSDKGVDRVATPKESVHFDTFDSVLFNDRHIIKGSDVLGLDPINGTPAQGPDGRVFSEEDVLDLTLLNIVKKRELVSRLKIFDEYLGDEAKQLSWCQRRSPEKTAKDWPEHQQLLYFRAAAICVQNIKELNPDLTFEEIVLPRREIVLPTTPYRISLSFDRVKALQYMGAPTVLRTGRVDLDQNLVNLMRQASGRSLRAFGEFLEQKQRQAEEHGDMLAEIKRLYRGLHPEDNSLEGMSYPDVYRKLESAQMSFVSLAAFFQASLDGYQLSRVPDVGLFGADLEAFLKASISLTQRARDLRELDVKWRTMNRDDEEER